MMSCDIIQDLLVLYSADECSEQSRQLIEEHLKTCKHCRTTLETLRAPVMPAEDLSIRTDLDNRAQNFDFRNGFKKIRRRWLVSLLSVLLIFPLIGAGFMVRNQIRGDGIAFTNLDELLAARSFLKSVQTRQYEKAFAFLDVHAMYEEMTEGQTANLTDLGKEYTKVEIGGDNWYVNQEVHLNEYRNYSSSYDESTFWKEMMVYNDELRSQTLIPEDQFEAAAKLFTDRTDQVVFIDPAEQTIENEGSSYTRITTGDGAAYYYPLAQGFSPDQFQPAILMDSSFVIPASVFESTLAQIQKEQANIRESAEYYRKMGLEQYTELMREDFLANMHQLEETGITIESYSTSMIVKSSNRNGEWQVDANLNCRQNEERSATGGITAIVRSGSLRVSGGFSTNPEDAIMYTLIDLLSPSADVSDWYAAHSDSN